MQSYESVQLNSHWRAVYKLQLNILIILWLCTDEILPCCVPIAHIYVFSPGLASYCFLVSFPTVWID